MFRYVEDKMVSLRVFPSFCHIHGTHLEGERGVKYKKPEENYLYGISKVVATWIEKKYCRNYFFSIKKVWSMTSRDFFVLILFA
jgi:hypothetical protein